MFLNDINEGVLELMGHPHYSFSLTISRMMLVLLLIVREVLAFYIVNVLADSGADTFAKSAIKTQKTRLELLRNAQHVLKH